MIFKAHYESVNMIKLLQAGTGGHRSRYQHESWRALGECAVWCDRPSQMAI